MDNKKNGVEPQEEKPSGKIPGQDQQSQKQVMSFSSPDALVVFLEMDALMGHCSMAANHCMLVNRPDAAKMFFDQARYFETCRGSFMAADQAKIKAATPEEMAALKGKIKLI